MYGDDDGGGGVALDGGGGRKKAQTTFFSAGPAGCSLVRTRAINILLIFFLVYAAAVRPSSGPRR